jgi:hypothetical protein
MVEALNLVVRTPSIRIIKHYLISHTRKEEMEKLRTFKLVLSLLVQSPHRPPKTAQAFDH